MSTPRSLKHPIGSRDRRRWLAMVGLLVMLATFGTLLSIDLITSRGREFEMVRRESETLARVLERQVMIAVDKIEIVLDRTARDFQPVLTGARACDPALCNRDLAEWMSSIPEAENDSLRVIDSEGRVAFNAGTDAAISSVRVDDRTYFIRQKNDPAARLVISEPLLSRFTGKWLITLNRRIGDDTGRFLGLVQTALDAEYFQRQFSEIDIGQSGIISLFDTDMRLLARHPATPDQIGSAITSPPIQDALATGRMAGHFLGLSPVDGVERQYVFRKLERLPYVLVIGRSPSEFLAGWTRKAAFYVVGFVGLAAALISFLSLLYRQADENRRLVNQVFEASRESIVVTDSSGRIVAANAGFSQASGYSAAEVIGQPIQIMRSDRHDDPFFVMIWQSLQEEGLWRGEIWNRRKSGEISPQFLSISAVRDDDGAITHYIAVGTDISELLLARHQVEDSRRRLDEAQRLAGLGSWEYDVASGQVIWSDTTYAIFGLDPAQVTPTVIGFMRAIHPDDRPTFTAAWRRDRLATDEMLLRIRRPNGDTRHVLARARVNVGEDGVPVRIAGTLLDVTDREIASANRDLFRRIIDDAGQAIRVSTPDGRIVFVNRAYIQITGYTREQLNGRPYTDLLADPASDSARAVARAYAAGEGWSGLIDIRRANGTVFTSLSNVGVVLDSHGRVQYLFNISSDYATEIERQRELREARDAALQASQAKSAFLANMSHELRTPMNAILGFSQFLEMDPGLSDRHRDGVGAIYKAGTHLLELINEILDLARIEAGRIDLAVEDVAVDQAVAESLELIAPLARGRKLTVYPPPPTGYAVRADRIRLRQALVNLLSNAVKYNTPNGTIRVEVTPAAPGRVRIDIIDTGKGIAPERQAELFVPFNRLGEEFNGIEGTGIGLALTRRIVEAMEGSVGLDSEPGRGSRFWFVLPEAVPIAFDSATPSPAVSPVDQSETSTVLYIDDDPVNLKLVGQVFATLSTLRLISTPDPKVGLDLARRHRPNLILLDITLPDLDGWEVLARLRADPDTRAIKVMAVTALAMPSDIERGRATGFDAYLTKPIDIPTLLEAVHALLGQDRTAAADADGGRLSRNGGHLFPTASDERHG